MNTGRTGRKTAIAVPAAGLTTLLELHPGILALTPEAKASFTIENTGGNAFDAFQVSHRTHPDSPWIVDASATADFTTAIKSPLLDSNNVDPTALTATTGVFEFGMEVARYYAVKIEASSAVAGATTAAIAWNIGG